MLVPLLLLAVGAVLAGYRFFATAVRRRARAASSGAARSSTAAAQPCRCDAMHHVPAWVPLAPPSSGVAGIALPTVYMVRAGPAGAARRARSAALYRFL